MHKCPDCGEDCDCDGEETTWLRDTFFDCNHDCDDDCDDDYDSGFVMDDFGDFGDQ